MSEAEIDDVAREDGVEDEVRDARDPEGSAFGIVGAYARTITHEWEGLMCVR
jgi:hypothetical protein